MRQLSIFVIAICFLPLHLFSQVTKIRGKVVDKETQEPIPFANIYFKGTIIGTVSDFQGNYFLETKKATDTLEFSSVGYLPRKVAVQKFIFQTFDIELESDNYEIDEVVIKPKGNPAHPILKKIIANKENNHSKNISSYQCEIYNKIQVDINNVDEKFQKRKIFNQFQFVFENIDTSSLTGKPYLPVLLTESISDYYFTSEPSKELERVKASKISGVRNESLAQFTGKMYQKVEIYDNFMTIFEPGFVSPIADFGLMYYNYFLLDTLPVDGQKCYKISFKPKRKQERTFSGYFIAVDSSFAIKEIELRMAKDANINFINDYAVRFDYSRINDSTWFLTREKHIVDFNLSDKTLGFFGNKISSYQDIKLNISIPDTLQEINTNLIVDEDVMEKDTAFWNMHRHETLTMKEEKIYEVADSIQEVPLFKFTYDLISLLTTYYYVIGPFEYGPYYSTYSHNYVEGHRFRVGGRTSNSFSKKIMLTGHVAYGLGDEKFKYGLGALYIFNKNPRRAVEFIFSHDRRQLGQGNNAFLEDNIMTTLLRRTPNDKLTMVREYKFHYEREWFTGFSNSLTFRHQQIYPVEAVPFIGYGRNEVEFPPISSIINAELTLNTRFAWDEKFVYGEFERVSLGTKYPVLEFDFSYGIPGLFNSSREYVKAYMNISDKLELNPLGYLRYTLEAGKIWGTLPFPLLELHKGNETYAFDKYAFNMMNYYEFVSDQFTGLYAEHHFQGFFLNKIPLLRKLDWREVLSGRALIGELQQENQVVMVLPANLNGLTKPYYEAGVGVENILKLFRVDAMWRLAYLDNPNVQKFGVRVLMQVIL